MLVGLGLGLGLGLGIGLGLGLGLGLANPNPDQVTPDETATPETWCPLATSHTMLDAVGEACYPLVKPATS